MKFRDLAASAAAFAATATSAFAQTATGVSRASVQTADASQFGGDSTMLLILAVLLIGAGVALLAGNNSDKPSSP